MERNYPTTRFADLLAELSDADEEHPDVAVTHDSQWSLSVYRNGFVVLENDEEGEPRHLGPIDEDATISLMQLLAIGELATVLAHPWRPGYPTESDLIPNHSIEDA